MKEQSSPFTTMTRQKFRTYFQPSRVLLGVIPAKTESGFNVITLCFSMYCSYKPTMIAVAIQDRNESYELIQVADEYVLSVPGESMAQQAMACGRRSLREVDKVRSLDLQLIPSETVNVPGLLHAIANVEMSKHSTIKTGDHMLVVGQVRRFAVNKSNHERPLLSVGKVTDGYRVLAHEGMHRLAVVRG